MPFDSRFSSDDSSTLPDLDRIDSDLVAVCGLLDGMLGTVRGVLTQRLAMSQGLVSDTMIAIEDALKDRFLDSWPAIDDVKTRVQDQISGDIGSARGLAALAGVPDAYTLRPVAGMVGSVPSTVPHHPAPVDGFPTSLPVGPGGEPFLAPPPVPVPLVPGRTGSVGSGAGPELWYCVELPNGLRGCVRGPMGIPSTCLPPGGKVLSGPHNSPAECAARCDESGGRILDLCGAGERQPQPAPHPFDPRLPGAAPSIPGPASPIQSGIGITGSVPLGSVNISVPQQAGVQPHQPILPTGPGWYCMGCGNLMLLCHLLDERQIQLSLLAGCVFASGPHGSIEECHANCGKHETGETWFCICDVASGAKQCHKGGTEPPFGWVICSSPFSSQADCQAACKADQDGTGAGWYCRPDGKCELTSTPSEGSIGPFASESDCAKACKGTPAPPGGICCAPPPPCPPPPVIPPCPPVYVFPPGGGITTEPPPEGSEEKEKKECEKKKCKEDIAWRAWMTCDNICYVTNGHQPPREITDKLLCRKESLEEALACCPRVKCPDKPEKESCAVVGDGRLGSIPSGPGPMSAGKCPAGPSILNPWDSLESCHDIDSQIGFIQPPSQCELGYWLGLTDSKGNPVRHSTDEGLSTIGVWINDALSSFLGKIVCGVEHLVRSTAGGDRCSGQRQFGLDIKHSLLSWIERLAGANMDRYQNPIMYEQNYLCPTLLPSHSEATAAWLRNEISDDVWACWTKANGHLLTPATRLRETARARHTTGDMVRLWLRDKLKDDEFDERLRTLGYTRPSDYSEIRELSKQYPPYSDIIRLMVRDAADESIEDWPDSDRLWSEKYVKDLREWGKFAGIPDEVTKLLWRAHWSIPAPGQLNTIWQRERRRGDTIDGTRLGEQIRNALLQQDILPRWIPHLIGINYRVLGRVDIRRAYQIGVLDREQVDSSYIRLGHDDDSATALTEFTVRQARLALRQHSAVRSYMEFGISRDQASEELRDYGAHQEDIDWVLNWALNRARAKSRAVCVKAGKKQFLTGSLDDRGLHDALIGLGLDQEQVDIAVSTAQCEALSRGKAVSAATLCKWLEYGLIDSPDFHERLLRMGWTSEDAIRIVASCTQALNIRQSREQVRRQREQDAAAKRAERERKALEKELEREASRIERARNAAEARKEQREKLMLKAATRLHFRCSLPETSTILLVRDGVARARALGNTANEAVTAAVLAAENLEGGDCGEYLRLVDVFAIGEESAGQVANGGDSGSFTITPAGP